MIHTVRIHISISHNREHKRGHVLDVPRMVRDTNEEFQNFLWWAEVTQNIDKGLASLFIVFD